MSANIPIDVEIRGVSHSAIYYPPTWPDRFHPGDPEEINLIGLPALDPDRHPLLYEELLRQCREALLSPGDEWRSK